MRRNTTQEERNRKDRPKRRSKGRSKVAQRKGRMHGGKRITMEIVKEGFESRITTDRC
jgi:hypothetical protein